MSVLENTEAQRTATLVSWPTEDSLTIKACAIEILMLFLTSCTPLLVVHSKIIIHEKYLGIDGVLLSAPEVIAVLFIIFLLVEIFSYTFTKLFDSATVLC